MKTKIISYLTCILFFFIFVGNTNGQTLPDEIVSAFKNGDAQKLASYFNTNIELVVIDKVDVYSRSQAEYIMRDFFRKNSPVNFSKLYTSGRKSASYAIANLSTTGGTYRIYLLMKELNGKTYIYQIRIDDYADD